MKYKVSVALILIVIVAGYFAFTRVIQKSYEEKVIDDKSTFVISPTPTVFVEESEAVVENIDPEKGDYKVNWVVIRNNSKLALYSNVINRLTSEELKLENNCNHLVSAGFIDEENNHIGLFLNHDGLISKSIQSSTFNGYFSIDDKNIAKISTILPENPKIAVQTGPLLFSDNKPPTLSLRNDEYSRRIVVAVSRQKEAIFIVFYSKSSPFSGPRLSELPQLLENLENNSSINLTDAINLDGGTHSAFKSGQLNLTEASIAGGYFCVKY